MKSYFAPRKGRNKKGRNKKGRNKKGRIILRIINILKIKDSL
jgi:hypothetical protein